jgi:hypothetical protein
MNYVLFDSILTVASSFNLIIEELASESRERLIAIMILERYHLEVVDSLCDAKVRLEENYAKK